MVSFSICWMPLPVFVNVIVFRIGLPMPFLKSRASIGLLDLPKAERIRRAHFSCRAEI